MAATTTEFIPTKMYAGSCVPYSTAVVGSTAMYSTAGGPGAISLTTAGDVVRIPFGRPDGKMAISVTYHETITASTAVYAACALRNPPSTDRRAWRALGTGIGTSTAESGWAVIQSTAVMTATSIQLQTYLFGPFESARYGQTMGGTSTNSIDKGQLFLEMMFGYSTKTSGTWAALATNAPAGGYYVTAVELP